MNEPATAPADNNSFDALMREFDRQRILDELNETYTGLVLAVRQHGRKGKISFTVEVAPSHGSDARTVDIKFDIEAKLPKAERRVCVYYTTEDGRTVKNDPEQAEMNFRPLPTAQPTPASQPATAATTA